MTKKVEIAKHLAEKMYRSFDAVKVLLKEEYPEKIKYYVDHINKYSEVQEVSILDALIILLELPAVKANPTQVMLFLAAAVEILEPDRQPTTSRNKFANHIKN